MLAASRLPRLVELRIALSRPRRPSANLPQDLELVDVAAAIASLPTLRRLAIDTETPPLPLLSALRDSRVARLHLAGFPLDEACVKALGDAARLRELDLRGAQFTEQGRQVLAVLGQLTRLDLRGAILSPEQLTTLQEWLPQCEVLTSSGTTTRTFPALANPSSWTADR